MRPGARPSAWELAGAGHVSAAILTAMVVETEGRGRVLLDDATVESVHRLRVSIRRLRALLSFFGPIRRRPGRPRATLARAADLAGQVRDLDVLGEHVQSGAAGLAPDDVDSARVRISDSRDAAAGELTAFLTASDWWDALSAVVRSVSEPPKGGGKARRRLADTAARVFVADRLDAWWSRLVADSEGLAGLASESRHKVRIRAKRMRYALEETARVFPEQTERREAVLADIEELQDALGALNDQVVGARVLTGAGFDVDAAEVGSQAELVRSAGQVRDRLVGRQVCWPAIPAR